MTRLELVTLLDEVVSMFDDDVDYTGQEIRGKIEKVRENIMEVYYDSKRT